MVDTAELLDALKDARKALQWASFAHDFLPGGKARRGWLRTGQPALDNATLLIAVAEREGKGS